MLRLIIAAIFVFAGSAPVFGQTGDREGEQQVSRIAADKIPPAPPLTPEEALKSFKIQGEFEIQIVASEPLIQNPVMLRWDASGRLWVLEMRSFMPNAEGSGEVKPVSQVAILHDLDGDGRMDGKTVFLDNLVMPRAMAFTGDGVLICEPPGLYYYPILPGDKAGPRVLVDPDYAPDAGHNRYDHSEHYLHSGFCDLIVTGLIGLRPHDDNTIEVNPLVPEKWDFFALDDLAYRGHRISVIWDRSGEKYGRGKGMRILLEGETIAQADRITKLTATLPEASASEPVDARANYAVNNSMRYFPKFTASYTADSTRTAALGDGQFWYHRTPPNRWTSDGSTSEADWAMVNFGVVRPIDEVKLYFLDDRNAAAIDYLPIYRGYGEKPEDERPKLGAPTVAPPASFDLEYRDGETWRSIPDQERDLEMPEGRRANRIGFPMIEATAIRAVFTHSPGFRTGLSEIETWGPLTLPLSLALPPAGNLAANPNGGEFPKPSASFTSKFDPNIGEVNDGLVNYRPTPHNRWTCFESPNREDWLALDFGKPVTFSRVVLHPYGARGKLQPPASYDVQAWIDGAWKPIPEQMKSPSEPASTAPNEITFPPVTAQKLRVVFKHRNEAWSGLTEIEVWKE